MKNFIQYTPTEIVFGKDTEMRTLLGAIRQEIKEMEKVVNIDYAPVTINRYKNVLKKLENSIPTFYDKEDITFHELTPEFIKGPSFKNRSRFMPQHYCTIYEMFQENHKYGTGKRLDEERCVLWIPNGAG